MLACADIEEGIVLRAAGVRVPILVFGALSVSDLDGIFQHYLTPTISTPSAARALQAAAAKHGAILKCHLKIDTGMNRLGFRHDNLRAHAARGRREPQPADRRGLHALRDGRRARESRRSPSSARGSRRRLRDARGRSGSRPRTPPRGQQRRAAARRARLVRLRPPRTAALRHRAAAARGDAAAATRPVTP